MGPSGRAKKLDAAQIPTALGRSALLNRTVRDEIAITITPAPASPSRTRAAMKAPTDVEYAHAADPNPKSPRAMSRTFLWPERSPKRPAGSIAAASTRKYPDENHCRSDPDACSTLDSAGSATLSSVPSKPTATTTRLTAPSAHHFLGTRIPMMALLDEGYPL